MSLNDKMTAIANKIREILGITGAMGLDDMNSGLCDCQDIVDSQANLLDQAILAIANKSSNVKLQSKVIIPTESVQVAAADNGFDGLSKVTVGAVDDEYIGSSINRLSERVYTPGISDQIIPDRSYIDGKQTILGDANLLPENIRLGSSIFGVAGAYEDIGIDTSDATATPGDIVEGATCYVNGEKIVGELRNISSSMSFATDYGTIDTEEDPNYFYYLTAKYPDGGYIPKDAEVSLLTHTGSFGDAGQEDVCVGKTFTSSSGVKIEGSVQMVDTDLSKNFVVNKPEIVIVDGVKHLGMVADVSDSIIFRSGSHIEIDTKASNLGNAAAKDVVSGKTFTSINGVKIVGTKVDQPSLPDGISKIATGTFTLSNNSTKYYTIQHNLGVIPNFVYIIATGDINISNFNNYSLCCGVFIRKITPADPSLPVSAISVELYGGSTSASVLGGVSYMANGLINSSSAYVSTSKPFKSGVTYRWVCGLTST